jgi:hypothetical protein
MLLAMINRRPERSNDETRWPAVKALTVTNDISKQNRQSQAA